LNTQPRPLRDDLGSTIAFVVAAAVGLAATFDISYIGHIYLAELMLMPIGAWFVLRGRVREIRFSRWKTMLAFFILGSLGYVASDLIVHSLPEDYLRGWARLAFLFTNVVGFIALMRRHVSGLVGYLCGSAAIGLALNLANHAALSEWKFGWAAPISLAGVLLTYRLERNASVIALVLLGGVNIFMDFKSLGIICLVVAGLSGYVRWGRTSSSIARALVFITVAIPAIFAAFYVYQLTYRSTEKAARSSDGATERVAALETAAHAIIGSPIIGYGSWAKNPEYAAYFIETRALLRGDAIGANADHANNFDLEAIQAHSQILQAWTEGGIAAAAFFICYAYFLAGIIYYVVVWRQDDNMTIIYLYILISGVWNVLFSPFAGDHRQMVGLAIAVVLCLQATSPHPGLGPPRPARRWARR